ncbi:serine protease easter-like isoform X2 [Episyrphus balteatus]|uniref:serine protease easter-like isoform X2 n=1 Tax=Episyrphus balteatus TaxID=286459 RepID=UPI002485CA0E|nr:serine protease easter-like isoform X2 [Episyrphus balteatus]
MCNKLTHIVLGIVLIFSANGQITKLFPVIEEVSTKISELPIVNKFFNDPYSPKVVYPPPPGVKRPATSSTEPTLSTLPHLTTNDVVPLTTTFKTPISSSGELIPNYLSLANALSSTTEGPLASESIQNKIDESISLASEISTSTEGVEKVVEIKQETTKVIGLSSTTEGFSEINQFEETKTDKINHIEEGNLSAEASLDKTTKGPLTEIQPPTEITTTPSTVSESTPAPKCTTPIGKPGECKDIRQCPSLISLLMREPFLVENKLYLQRSQCGYENQTVLACCPDHVPAPIESPKLSLLPQPRKCGSMFLNRLYGGYTTDLDSFGWNALLEYAKGGNEKGFHCGGTLISDRYVLTAAHCVTNLPETWTIQSVRLGEWDLETELDCSSVGNSLDCNDPPVNVAIEEVIPHKDYSSTSTNRLNDIALIRLSTQVKPTANIEPICLPYGDNKLHAFDDQSLDMVGWGVTPEGLWNTFKQRTNAQVIPLNKCRSRYAERNIQLESTQFCVEGRLRNDTCRIDSGGPVISFDTANKGLGSFYLAGIQSLSPTPCWAEKLPGVYTRVADYLDWILENIRA